jgi:hypothetical protein
LFSQRFIFTIISAVQIFLICAGTEIRADELSTRHFRFIYEPEDQSKAVFIKNIAEGEFRYVSYMLGLKNDQFPEPMKVYIAPDKKSMCMFSSNPDCTVEEWVAGFALPEKNSIVVSIRGNVVFQLEDTFIHELSHIMLEKATGGRFTPKWFSEGVAMYVAKEPLIERLDRVLTANVFKKLPPLSSLERSLPRHAPAVHLAYSQSLMFVRFLIKLKGRGSIMDLIGMTGNGIPFNTAFETIFKSDVSEIEKQYLSSLNRNPYIIYIVTGSGTLWILMTVLFILSFLKKRKRNRLKLKAWEISEEIDDYNDKPMA